MSDRPKVYLAGPGVFARNAKARGDDLVALCARHGLEGLWPADDEIPRADPGFPPHTKFSYASFIYRNNLLKIREAAAMIADISPFRGLHMDPGTAFEIGIAAVAGKPVFAFGLDESPRRPLRPLIERMWCEQTSTGWRDHEGYLVEDFGLVENLMIGCSIRPDISPSAESAIRLCAEFLRSGS